jgi:hypothetical protein
MFFWLDPESFCSAIKFRCVTHFGVGSLNRPTQADAAKSHTLLQNFAMKTLRRKKNLKKTFHCYFSEDEIFCD